MAGGLEGWTKGSAKVQIGAELLCKSAKLRPKFQISGLGNRELGSGRGAQPYPRQALPRYSILNTPYSHLRFALLHRPKAGCTFALRTARGAVPTCCISLVNRASGPLLTAAPLPSPARSGPQRCHRRKDYEAGTDGRIRQDQRVDGSRRRRCDRHQYRRARSCRR